MDPISTGVATKLLSDVLVYVAKDKTNRLVSKLKQFIPDITASYGPHLERTLKKCKFVKTILHGDQPVNLLQMYVNVKFTLDKALIEDVSIINDITSKFSRTVISGTAGSGKTVFMKYLFISLYERSQGKIPVFFELRALNNSDVRDVLDYIYFNVFHSPKNFSREKFHELAEDGAFHFILDGYDEINFNIRDQIEKSILRYAEKYDKCNFVVSGRPDESFKSWEMFSVL